jgi:hypothetical protein
LGLGVETGGEIGLVGIGGEDDLDGYVPAGGRLESPVDDAISPGADLFF